MKTSRPGKTSLALTLVAAGFLLPAQQAMAACKLRIEGPVTTLTVADNSPQDTNPADGVVVFIGPVDSIPSVVVTCVTKPVVGSPDLAEMDIAGISVNGVTAESLRISATDTDYLVGSPGGEVVFTSAVGGTTTGTSTFHGYLDAANAEFGIAGASVCTPGPQGPFNTLAFDSTLSTLCQTTGAVSLTFVADTALDAGGNQSFGATLTVPRPSERIGCRFTGGGVDTNYNWDHTLESGQMIRNGAGNLPDPIDRYQFGGQAGARTGQQPTPSGEWQHHQQTGPSGAFSFHGGTASAAPGTWIADIRCSDPGFCRQARPAPAKQLDFDGVGTFSNLGKGKNAAVFQLADPNVIPEPAGKKGAPFTFHWFEVNIDDMGEPGRLNVGAPNSLTCPGRGFGAKSAGVFYPDPVNNPGGSVLLGPTLLGNCDCPDFYRITVFKGVLSTDVTFLPNGKVDPASMNRTDVIYEVSGYIDGGNLQIHPPTGYDTN